MYGSPAHRYDALILNWRWFLWQTMKICKIRCNSSAQQKHQYIYQSVAPQFSSRLLSLALWCQKFDSVMSGQSDANLRIIGIQCVNTESCSASHKWIALHCCVGAIRWLGVRARTVMPVRRWRTSADTQSLTRLQYMKKNTQANCTIHRPLLTHTVYTGNTGNIHSIQTVHKSRLKSRRTVQYTAPCWH